MIVSEEMSVLATCTRLMVHRLLDPMNRNLATNLAARDPSRLLSTLLGPMFTYGRVAFSLVRIPIPHASFDGDIGGVQKMPGNQVLKRLLSCKGNNHAAPVESG
jgi:hypothetical protein